MQKIALLAILIAILFTVPNLIAVNIEDYECKNRINDSFLSSIENGDDFLDQYQHESGWISDIVESRSRGQSFIPSYDILTRIKLLVNSYGDPTFDLHFYLLGNFAGESFIHMIIPAEEIPISDAEWIDIDFEDIMVNPGETYYIALLTSATGDGYHWKSGYNTEYTNGDAWYHMEGDETWSISSDYDMCFETYGKPNLQKVFIIGKIYDINSDGDYITFNALKVRCIQLSPFNFITLQSDEELIISKSYKGIVAAGFIFAFCDAAIL